MVLGIYGSGGCGREVRDIAELLGTWKEIVFIDDIAEEGMFKGIERMSFRSFIQRYNPKSALVIIAVGEPKDREDLYNKVKEKGYSFANVIHPLAWISPLAKLGQGILIKAWAVISCDTIVEDNVRIETFVVVGHDCIVRRGCQLSPNVTMGGRSEIGSGTYIGINVPIKEDIRIGAGSVVGMGSVVLRDIPDNVIALGNPARAMKHKDESKVFK